jgi:hypothetical protein
MLSTALRLAANVCFAVTVATVVTHFAQRVAVAFLERFVFEQPKDKFADLDAAYAAVDAAYEALSASDKVANVTRTNRAR